MDLRTLGAAKEHVAQQTYDKSTVILKPSPFGEDEETTAAAAKVAEQVSFERNFIQTPMSQEKEVQATEPVHSPKIRKLPPKPGKSDEDSKAHVYTFFEHDPATITRRPNRWETLCNLDIAAGQVITAWNAKVNLDSIFIQNQSSSAGSVYIAPDPSLLRTNPIRGKGLAAGDSITLNLEAGGFMIAPSGATVDIILLWYEDEESRPVNSNKESD